MHKAVLILFNGLLLEGIIQHKVEGAASGCTVPAISNGVVMLNNRKVSSGTKLNAGNEVSVSCNNEYVKEGSDASVYVCGDSGQWRPPMFSIKCNSDFSECGRTSQQTPNIYGGGYANTGELPWMAKMDLVFPRGSPLQCGAFLISKEWLLTAAHCVSAAEQIISVTVHLGRTNFSSDRETEIIRSTATYCTHPSYDPASAFNFDFALVHIEPVSFTKLIRPICLPSQSQCSSLQYSNSLKKIDGCNRMVTAAGWGLTKSPTSGPHLSTSLKKVNLTLYSKDECLQFGGDSAITDAQLCAGSSQSNEDSCTGDSGGPLTCVQNNKVVAVGVISTGPSNCGEENTRGTYSRICHVLPWINKIITGNSCPTRPATTTAGPVTDPTEMTTSTTTESPAECTTPDVENGAIVGRNGAKLPSGSSLEAGSAISLKCNQGYSSSSVGSKRCSVAGEWLPKSPGFRCLPQSGCQNTLPSISHGRVIAGSSTAGSKRTVSCDNSYTLKGANFIICQANGTWSKPGRCDQLSGGCGIPRYIDNAAITNGRSTVGSSRRIICDPSFSFSGSDDTIVCQPSGEWSKPRGTCVLLEDTTATTNEIATTTRYYSKMAQRFLNYTAWFDAAFDRDPNRIKAFIQQGADINAKNSLYNYWTALHYTAWAGGRELALLLIQNRAEVNGQDNHEVTPLMIAARWGNNEVYQVLIDNGADINARDDDDRTTLIWATMYGQEQLVKMIVRNPRHTALNAKCLCKKTALQWAIERPINTVSSATYSRIVTFLSTSGATI